MDYLNFDVNISKLDETRYQAQVIRAPTGDASTEFEPPLSRQLFQNFTNSLYHPTSGYARKILRQVGISLSTALFRGDVYALYYSSLCVAMEKKMGLRIQLRIDPSELNILPWEYMYDPRLDQAFSLSSRTPILRTPKVIYPYNAVSIDLPLNVLAVISNPTNLPSLNVEQEIKNLEKAFKECQYKNLIALDFVVNPTREKMQDQLRQKAYQIIHYVGHGSYNSEANEGYIFFCNADGTQVPCSSQQFIPLIANHHIKMVMLNACHSASSGNNLNSSSIAQRFVQQGIPAVLAMQGNISDKSAIVFSQEFYRMLANGDSLEIALSEARLAMNLHGSEWGIPVCITHISDGYLFKLRLNEDVSIDRGPSSITIKLHETIIKILFGDLFTHDGYSAIPVSRHFFEIDLVETSLQKKVMDLFSLDGPSVYQRNLRKALKDVVYEPINTKVLSKRKYDLGTTILLKRKNEKYLFFAITETEQRGRIPVENCSISALWTALERFWIRSRQFAIEQSINIPLIGSGISGIRLDPMQILSLNLLSIINALTRYGRITTGEIRIVLHPRFRDSIDLELVRKTWQPVLYKDE